MLFAKSKYLSWVPFLIKSKFQLCTFSKSAKPPEANALIKFRAYAD